MTQDPELRKNLDIEGSSKKLENFLRASIKEMKDFSRLTGNNNVHDIGMSDVATTNSEISDDTDIQHV